MWNPLWRSAAFPHGLHADFVQACIVVSLFSIVVCGCRPPASTVACDQSTPESVVNEYYRAVAQKDTRLFGALYAVDEATRNDAERAFTRLLDSGLWYQSGDDIRLDVVENDGQTARIWSHVTQTTTLQGDVVFSGSSGGWFTLVRLNERWYLIGLGQSTPPGWTQE